MSSHSATDPDVFADIFTVSTLDNREGYISQPEAMKWAFKIIRGATKEAQTRFEGELHKVIPLKKTVTGMLFKLHFIGVPDFLMSTVIIPAFEREGTVTKFSKDEEQHDKTRSARKAEDAKARARAIGDIDGTKTLLTKLLLLRGDGGPDNAKKRRFADHANCVLARSQRFAAYGMREEREDALEIAE